MDIPAYPFSSSDRGHRDREILWFLFHSLEYLASMNYYRHPACMLKKSLPARNDALKEYDNVNL
jgi:hypothetical protein